MKIFFKKEFPFVRVLVGPKTRVATDTQMHQLFCFGLLYHENLEPSQNLDMIEKKRKVRKSSLIGFAYYVLC